MSKLIPVPYVRAEGVPASWVGYIPIPVSMIPTYNSVPTHGVEWVPIDRVFPGYTPGDTVWMRGDTIVFDRVPSVFGTLRSDGFRCAWDGSGGL